jgi:hypothetical protein
MHICTDEINFIVEKTKCSVKYKFKYFVEKLFLTRSPKLCPNVLEPGIKGK